MRPTAPTPRFPATRVDAAARRIAAALDEIGAGPEDLALTQGAAGGDLLFAEACLARAVPLRLLLPLAEREFVAASLLPVVDGAAWHARFRAVVDRLDEAPREAPVALGPLAPGDDAFVRANLWLLDSALAFGAEQAELHLPVGRRRRRRSGRHAPSRRCRPWRRRPRRAHRLELALSARCRVHTPRVAARAGAMLQSPAAGSACLARPAQR